MYAMVCTRLDIAHAVGVMSRYMSRPGKQHWEAVKWILRYLRGSTDACLYFIGVTMPSLDRSEKLQSSGLCSTTRRGNALTHVRPIGSPSQLVGALSVVHAKFSGALSLGGGRYLSIFGSVAGILAKF